MDLLTIEVTHHQRQQQQNQENDYQPNTNNTNTTNQPTNQPTNQHEEYSSHLISPFSIDLFDLGQQRRGGVSCTI